MVLCLGFCMILLDTTVVQVAMPSIIRGLHLWAVNAYILVYAVLLITAGRLGDLLGQRTMFAAGLVLLTGHQPADRYCHAVRDVPCRA